MVAGRAGAPLDGDPEPETGVLMTWDEVREMASMGIGIGAHTMTHARLARLDPAQQRTEITDSKKLLEDRLGRPVSAFAYPYGSARDYTAATMDLVREAGFAFAVSNRYGRWQPQDSPWQIRRMWIDATDSLSLFQGKVDGTLDLLWLQDSAPGIALRRGLNRLLR